MRKFKKFYTFICLVFAFSGAKSQTETASAPAAKVVTVDSTSANNNTTAAAKVTTTKAVKFGTASYYASKFEGRKTATGEVFRHAYYTAASNFFKLNVWVRVTNLINGKSAIVRINDRMAPSMASKGRVIDLTKIVAEELKIISKGIAKVKVEAVPVGTQN